MAALKLPILEIPLDDAKWQKFAASFRAYEDEVQKMPEHWKRTTAAILNQGSAFRQLGNSTRPVERFWKNVAGWSGSVLSTTMGITRELLKWGTLLGGGLLGGSLFGISRLASDTANYRRTALGLGMSIGGYRSFGVNFGRLGDPGGFLSAINQMVSNPSLQGPLYALGVDPSGSTSQVAVATLKAMRQLAKSVPRGELGLYSEAYGLGPLGGLTRLMLLRATGNKEFAAMLAGNTADKGALGISPKTALAWQNFTTQLERAGGEIFTVFVKGLAPLEKPLERLSASLAGFLTRLMQGPALKQGIDSLAKFLDTWNGTLGSPPFLKSAESLARDIESLAKSLGRITGHEAGGAAAGAAIGGLAAGPLGAVAGAAMGATGGDIYGMYAASRWRRHFLRHPTLGAYNAAARQLDAAFGLPAGLLERVKREESGSMLTGVPNSSAGAVGIMQLMPATAKALGVDPRDPLQATYGAAEYLSSLARRYHGNMQEALAAYNWGPKNVDRLVSRYGSGWRGHLPRGVNSYVTAISSDSSIVVTARHKTGGSAVLAGAGLAAVPGT